MLDRDDSTNSQFASTFPARFAAALDQARGAMAGIAASVGSNGGLISPEALQRLHEVYRLRIELEIETAGLLWRTAEVVCALTDAIEAVNTRVRPAPLPPVRWLGGLAGGVAERRRARVAIQDDRERRRARWPDLGTPNVAAEAEHPVSQLPVHAIDSQGQPLPAGGSPAPLHPSQRWREAA